MKNLPANVAHALQKIDSELAFYFLNPEAIRDRASHGSHAISIIRKDVTLDLACGHSVNFSLKSLVIAAKGVYFEAYEQAQHVRCPRCGHEEFVDEKNPQISSVSDTPEGSIDIEATVALLRSIGIAQQAERQADKKKHVG